MDKEIKNAMITNVSITMDDHCALTFYVSLEGAGWFCKYGGYCFGNGDIGWKPEEFSATGSGLVAMMRIMDTVGVRNWEDLVGKYVRCKVVRSGEGIDEIGNIIKDKWFNIREYFASVKESKEEKDG